MGKEDIFTSIYADFEVSRSAGHKQIEVRMDSDTFEVCQQLVSRWYLNYKIESSELRETQRKPTLKEIVLKI
jgi:hypothetical protein